MEISDLVGERGEVLENVVGLTNGSDSIMLDENGAVSKHAVLGIHGYDHRVVEYHR